MQTVPDANDVHCTDLLTLFNENLEEGYKVLFDYPTTRKETVLHYPLSKKETLADIFRLSSKKKETWLIPQLSSDQAVSVESEKCIRMIVTELKICSISCLMFYTYQRTFLCKNNVCGNHLKQVLYMDPRETNQDLRENDDQIRYDEKKTVKCRHCRSDLEECVELRCQREFQIASGTLISDSSFRQPISLVLNKLLMNRFHLGDTVQVVGYPRMILDSRILSKIKPNPLAVYVDVFQAQIYSPINTLKIYNNELGAEVIDFLLNEFCLGGKLKSSRWRKVGLVSLAGCSANSSGSPIDVCFITDEVLLLKHLLHSIGCKSLNLTSEIFDSVKKRLCPFITGKSYTISESGLISYSAKETLIYEFTKTLSVKTFRSLLELDRKCGIIGLCPVSLSKSKIGDVIKSFDIVVDLSEDLDRDDMFEEADAVLSLAMANISEFDFSSYIKPKTGELTSSGESESLQRSYFIEKRSLIGKENENSDHPIYDPPRQLSLGIWLSKAFAILNSANRVRKIDVFLGIIVQEINLATRFHKSVFKDQIQDDPEISTPLLFNQGLPSPCPSTKRNYPEVNGYQHFKNVHGEVIESLCSQLGLN